MRPFIILSLVLGFQGCTQKKETATENRDSIVSNNQVSTRLHSNLIQIPEDSSLFISHIMTFPETSEYYVPLYHLEGVRGDIPYEYLTTQLDSVIYNDEEVSRKRLPFNIAKQYFNLSGLGRVSVYNNRGDLITDAMFERVEYLEGVIESEFVAVFKPMIPSWYSENVAYCISTTPNDYKQILPTIREVKNDGLSKKLFKHFEIDSSKVWVNQHFEFLQYKSIYSIIAWDNGSYLIETIGEQSSILFETKDDESIIEILPVHLEINDKPVLLITEGVNETDMIWTFLAVYTSQAYEPMAASRIKKK